MPLTAAKPSDLSVASAPAGTGRRLDFVDGLRGLACLYVVLYHLFLLWPVSSHIGNGDTPLLQLLTRVAAYGHIGVDVFLVLSGFCLFYPLSRKALFGSASLPQLDIRAYASRRALRILPPYFVTLAFFSLLPFWSFWAESVHASPTLPELLTHLTLVHNLFPLTILRIDGPLWSLALEAQLYVTFPVLVFLFRRVGPFALAALVFLACAGFRIFAWGTLGVSSAPLESQFVMMGSLPARLFEFGAGMLAAYIVSRQRGPRQRWLGPTAAFVSVLGLAIAYVADKNLGEHSPFPEMAWGIMAAGLLVAAGTGALRPLERALSWRPLVAVGLVSYSIYLIHEPLLRLTGAVVGRLGLAPMQALLLFIVLGGPLLLALAAAFWFAFERPFVRSAQTRSARINNASERGSGRGEPSVRLATADLN